MRVFRFMFPDLSCSS